MKKIRCVYCDILQDCKEYQGEVMVVWMILLCFSRKIGRDDSSVPECNPDTYNIDSYNDVAPLIIIRPMY